MKRADLFKLAAALPIGALALVPEKPEEPLPNPLAAKPNATTTNSGTKWVIVHAGDGSTLPTHHAYGDACGRCAGTGVPAPLWYAAFPFHRRPSP
jgi:hypothetical protein